MTGRVLVVGDAAADLTMWKAEKTHITNGAVRMTRGGAAANTAAALAGQGVAATFLGGVGDDSLGRLIREDLARRGVDVSGLRSMPQRATPLIIYAIDDVGDVWATAAWPRLTASAVFGLAPEHVDEQALRGYAWLHVVGLCLLAPPLRTATLALMRAARRNGVPVSLDLNLRAMEEAEPAEFSAVLAEALENATVVLGSADQEFTHLYPDLPPERAARRIATDRRVVIMREGARGATIVTTDDALTIEPPRVDVVSPVGAGDAFNAGFIAAALTEADLATAVRRGNAAAALTIARGDATSPTATEIDRLLRPRTPREDQAQCSTT